MRRGVRGLTPRDVHCLCGQLAYAEPRVVHHLLLSASLRLLDLFLGLRPVRRVVPGQRGLHTPLYHTLYLILCEHARGRGGCRLTGSVDALHPAFKLDVHARLLTVTRLSVDASHSSPAAAVCSSRKIAETNL